MTWVRLAAAAALLASCICAALSASAKADDEPIRTVYWKAEVFKKGEPFDVECERGSYLVGFDGQAGDWIDHLRLVCSRWDAARGRLEQQAVLKEGKVGYSQGGKPTRPVSCPIGSGIAGDYDEHYAQDGSAYVLHTLEFHCVNATDGTRPRWRIFGSPSSLAAEYNRPRPHAGCPEGYLATGIYGRAGEFIDRLFGFVCRRRPTASPVAEAKPLGSVARAPAKWRTKGNVSDMIAGGSAGTDIGTTPSSPPPPPPPPPAAAMAETTDDTDVYLKIANGAFVRTDRDPNHFLPKGFVAPVLAKEGGWWKLELKNIAFAPGGEGWVAADYLKQK